MGFQSQLENTMTLEKLSYTASNRLPGGWKDILMKQPLLHLVCICLLAAQAIPTAVQAQVKDTPPIPGVLGKLQSFTDTSLDVQTKSGVVHVSIRQPLTTYKQMPSDLSHVTSTSYVGVASTEQADGTELAKQILIFPAELRGAAEGSVIRDATPGTTTHSRMTNGSISRPAVSHSRMTNGTVQKGSGTTLVVRYQDGAQTISVPPNVPVTEVVPANVTLAAGDTVYVATEKQPNGTLMTNKIFLIAPAPSQHQPVTVSAHEPFNTSCSRTEFHEHAAEIAGRASGQEASSPGALESLAECGDPFRPYSERHRYLLESESNTQKEDTMKQPDDKSRGLSS